MKQDNIIAEDGQPTTNSGEIIIYQPNSSIRLEVRMEKETVWLNRKQMATLFNRDKKTIGKHVNNALKEELAGFPVVAKFATTADDGKNYQTEYFFDGQIFDAYTFISDLIRSAKRRIILIDNYIDDSVLLMLAKRGDGITAEIVTRRVTETLSLDIKRHNLQYPSVTARECDRYHDRFLIIDDTVYHIAASLKDLGKRLFAFNRMEMGAEEILIWADRG